MAVPARVETRFGAIEGTGDGGIYRFLGVPFAAPPTGAARWRPPRPVAAWSGVRPAQTFGPACFQAVRPGRDLRADAGGEDCLYLNVWTRTLAADARQPVMVWLHGGGYLGGAGSEAAWEGSAFAADGIVLVTLNYRLHVFGYLAHPEIGGNFGVLDQLAALAWIKEHATAFGGDPDNIILFGESAGADATSKLMGCPAADGLFHKAILQSGGYADPVRGGRGQMTPARAALVAERLLARLGQADFAAARALPTAAVWEAADRISGVDLSGKIATPGDLVWVPVLDDDLLPCPLVPRGDRPLVLGFNDNEARYFIRPGRPYDAAALEGLLVALCGDDGAADASSSLDRRDGEAIYASLDRLFTTALFAEPAFETALTRSAAGLPTWLYHFSRVSPGARQSGLLAVHTAEIPYVFATLPDGARDDADRMLSASMHAAWVAFARTGRPVLGDESWPSFAADRPVLAEFGEVADIAPFEETPLFRAVRRLRPASAAA